MIHSPTNIVVDFTNAYQWLCKGRKKHPPDSDIWCFKRDWTDTFKETIKNFTTGSYRFDIQKKVTLACGETIAMWSSIDSLVIKVLTGILQDKLKPYLSETALLHIARSGASERRLGLKI